MFWIFVELSNISLCKGFTKLKKNMIVKPGVHLPLFRGETLENIWNKPPRPSGCDSSLGLHLWKLWSLLRGNLAIPHHQRSMKNQLVIVEPPWRSTGGTAWHGHMFCSTVKMYVLRPSTWQDDRSGTSKIHQQKKTQIHFSILLDSPNLQVPLFRDLSVTMSF